MNIAITNNPKEQVEIGRHIVEEKSEIYNTRVISKIEKTIIDNMPHATQEERKSMFYRSIYDYWIYGNNISEEFCYRFYQKGHDEKATYLTYNNRMPYMRHLNDKKDAHYLNNKYEAYLELKKYYLRDVILIRSDEDFNAFCDFVEKHNTFVVKPEDLGYAAGVYKYSMPRGADKRDVFEGFLQEAKELKNQYGWPGRDSNSIILEEIIDQDDAMSKMHPASANVIRCTTIYVNGKVHIYYPYFKFGVGGEFVVDEALGSLMAGINAETGEVDTLGYNEKGESFYYHPTTGVEIPGFKIPKWNELVEILEEIGTHFPTIHYIGWDMVLSKQGWCIMEGNFTGECLWQLVYGKGMKAELEELIDWKPQKDYCCSDQNL